MAVLAENRPYRWMTAGWIVFVLLLSFLPAHLKVHLHTKGQFHNAAHFLVFGVLAFLAAGIARTRDQKISNLFFTIVLGFFIEIAQDLKFVLPKDGNWVPVEWTDVLVDSMAVVAVGIVCLGVLPVLQRRMSGGSDADPLLSR